MIVRRPIRPIHVPIGALALLCSCSVEPMQSTWLHFVPLEGVPSTAQVVFADDGWFEGGAQTVGGETLIRIEGTEVQRSDDRGESWADVSPGPSFVQVTTAGSTLLVIEQAGGPWRVHVSRDAGDSWRLREYDRPAGNVLATTPEWLIVGSDDPTERIALDLSSGSSRARPAERSFSDGLHLAAPNGAVIHTLPPVWAPHRAIAAWTPKFKPWMVPQDYDIVQATGFMGPATPHLFTTDSRLVVSVDGALFVSEHPLDRSESQADEVWAGPGCASVNRPNPHALGGQNGVSITNGSTEPLQIWGWRQEQFVLHGEIEPTQALNFDVDIGFPVLAEDLDGRCVEVIYNTEDESQFTMGAL